MGLIKPNSGGVKLPELSNPATAENIQTGFEAINSVGEKVTGTHVEADLPELPSLTDAAAVSDILMGKEVINANGVKITGTMPDNGALNASLAAGRSMTIVKGYHNGNGVVYAKTLNEQTPADATAADIASGKTAWVNGQMVTGTKEEVISTTEVFEISSITKNLSSIPAPFPTTREGTISAYGFDGTKDVNADGSNMSSKYGYYGHYRTIISSTPAWKEFIWTYDSEAETVNTPVNSAGNAQTVNCPHILFKKEVTA